MLKRIEDRKKKASPNSQDTSIRERMYETFLSGHINGENIIVSVNKINNMICNFGSDSCFRFLRSPLRLSAKFL